MDLPRQRTIEDLSVEELRRLLVEKQKAERQARIEHFRQTGRLVAAASAPAETTARTQKSTAPGEAGDQLRTPDSRRRKRSPQFEKVLLIAEIAAVLGLVFVLLSGFNILRNLNRETASLLTQPTLTPTPLIMALVLPSGHTPPNSPGGVQPNEAEIPEHLRPLVQSLANLPVPTPGPEQAVRVQISALNVDAPVVQGDGWEQLKKGVGQHAGTPNPGKDGNIVLSAHNDVFGEIFRDLDRLKAGDAVTLFTNQRAFTYIVQETHIVEPTQVEWLAPTQDSMVTLISCYPYLVSNQRIVVRAVLQK
ncbi:MAG: class D sortase [Anaerolineaceae bacterium]|nr:class D sortase [Anaerolineaceae bacterium]